MTGALTGADVNAGALAIAAAIGLILAVLAVFLTASAIAEKRRDRNAPPAECGWCEPLGRYADISVLPGQCKCAGPCEATWCQARAVTA